MEFYSFKAMITIVDDCETVVRSLQQYLTTKYLMLIDWLVGWLFWA